MRPCVRCSRRRATPHSGAGSRAGRSSAGLCLAALVAVGALLTGSFDDTDWRVVATSLGFSVFTSTTAAGAALRLRSDAAGAGARRRGGRDLGGGLRAARRRPVDRGRGGPLAGVRDRRPRGALELARVARRAGPAPGGPPAPAPPHRALDRDARHRHRGRRGGAARGCWTASTASRSRACSARCWWSPSSRPRCRRSCAGRLRRAGSAACRRPPRPAAPGGRPGRRGGRGRRAAGGDGPAAAGARRGGPAARTSPATRAPEPASKVVGDKAARPVVGSRHGPAGGAGGVRRADPPVPGRGAGR